MGAQHQHNFHHMFLSLEAPTETEPMQLPRFHDDIRNTLSDLLCPCSFWITIENDLGHVMPYSV